MRRLSCIHSAKLEVNGSMESTTSKQIMISVPKNIVKHRNIFCYGETKISGFSKQIRCRVLTNGAVSFVDY